MEIDKLSKIKPQFTTNKPQFIQVPIVKKLNSEQIHTFQNKKKPIIIIIKYE